MLVTPWRPASYFFVVLCFKYWSIARLMDSETGTPSSFCMARSLASCSGFNRNATFFIMSIDTVTCIYMYGQQCGCRRFDREVRLERISHPVGLSVSGTISQTRSNNVSGAYGAIFCPCMDQRLGIGVCVGKSRQEWRSPCSANRPTPLTSLRLCTTLGTRRAFPKGLIWPKQRRINNRLVGYRPIHEKR